MIKKFQKSNMLKKAVALSLCVVMLGSHPAFAAVEQTMKDSSGNKIGTCYALGEKYVVNANTKSIKTTAGKYKYKSYVLAHVYKLKNGKRTTVDYQATSVAGSSQYAVVLASVNADSDAEIFGVATTHYIWKNGTKYTKSLND